MKDYLAYSYEVSGYTTYGLMPLNGNTPCQVGYWNYDTNELVLQSKQATQNIKLFPKIDEIGNTIVNKKGQKLVEKRTVNENLSFHLKNDEKALFIEQFVENSYLCKEIENAFNLKKQEEKNEEIPSLETKEKEKELETV